MGLLMVLVGLLVASPVWAEEIVLHLPDEIVVTVPSKELESHLDVAKKWNRCVDLKDDACLVKMLTLAADIALQTVTLGHEEHIADLGMTLEVRNAP